MSVASDGFSPEWEATFRDSKHLSAWPWSDLVSLVTRHARPSDGFTRVLELGCGAGANIPFFMNVGADYWGIDGSASVIERLHSAYPAMKGRLIVGDFTHALPGPSHFDLIIDRSALTYNATAPIRRCLALAFARLRPGGKYLACDWHSTAHTNAAAGQRVDDRSRRGIPSPKLSGVGVVHFSDAEHIRDLMTEAGFTIEVLEHKVRDEVIPAPFRHASWNFVAVKPT